MNIVRTMKTLLENLYISYNIDKDVCATHFAYIGSKSDDVWAGSLNEVLKYIYEKQTAKTDINWIRENALSLSLTDTMDDAIFNFPLTLKVNVPAEWEMVSVSQNGENSTVAVKVEDGKSFIYINVVPDKGDILVESI